MRINSGSGIPQSIQKEVFKPKIKSVCMGNGIEPQDVLDLLTQLVNKSLIISEREQGQEAGYRMLETIRAYALERLAESGELESLRGRHAQY